jgi:hypothetical protein
LKLQNFKESIDSKSHFELLIDCLAESVNTIRSFYRLVTFFENNRTTILSISYELKFEKGKRIGDLLHKMFTDSIKSCEKDNDNIHSKKYIDDYTANKMNPDNFLKIYSISKEIIEDLLDFQKDFLFICKSFESENIFGTMFEKLKHLFKMHVEPKLFYGIAYCLDSFNDENRVGLKVYDDKLYIMRFVKFITFTELLTSFIQNFYEFYFKF